MIVFLMALGLVLIIEGIPYFFFPDEIKRFIALIPTIDSKTLRTAGLIAISLGTLLLVIASNF